MTNSRKNKIYGNWTVLSIRGEEIFKCLEERANWYLVRNLATRISENPPTIQLNFEVKKEGNKGDAYYLSSKKNICVKCGTDNLEVLTKHHIVPQMYRKYMPLNIKSRNSFDVVPICFKHHDEYERFADELKNNISNKYNAPINGIYVECNELEKKIQAIKSSIVIVKHGDKIPFERKVKLLSCVRDYLEKADILDEDIYKLSVTPVESKKRIKTHGQIVMEQIEDHQGFVEMWRFHFLEYVNPKFMPDYWDPKRSINRN